MDTAAAHRCSLYGRYMADAAFANQLGWRRTIRAPAPAVDDEYACRRWDYLKSLEEMSRYAVIAGYCGHGGGVSSVLDLGCGAGVLRHWRRPSGRIQNVGVNLSKVAIDKSNFVDRALKPGTAGH